MTIGDARSYYREAWDRLFDLVMMRNRLLRRLDLRARPAMDVTPATGVVVEFDAGLARRLLDDIDVLTPRISAAIEEVNEYAEQAGSRHIRWQSVPLDIDS